MKHIIFDFDGTLANTLPVVVSIAEEMLDMDITKDDIEHYRNMTARAVLKETGIPLYKLPSLLVKGRSFMAHRMNEVKPITGLADVVKALAKGNKLYVVSSNGVAIINSYLKDNQLDQYFEAVYGNVGLFSKAQALKKVMKRQGFTVANAVYIGDEVRDIDSANKIKLPIISVTWGYNGKQLLEKHNAGRVVEKPKQILNLING